MPHQQDPERPPRPPNSWILYRSHMARERTDLEGRAQSEISAIISKARREAPPDIKLHFEMLAEAKEVEHQARYPHNRFNPVKKSDKAKGYQTPPILDSVMPRGSSSKGYTVDSTGMNSQGNQYCSRDYGNGSNSYHYSNNDGSYYYANPNGSTYYNDGKGAATYTPPSDSGKN